MNILIIRISAIGDVLHTYPAAKLLHQKFPHAKIHWVVQHKAAALLKDQPFLHTMHLLPDKPLHLKNWYATFKVIRQLQSTTWDAIIDFQGILKSFILIAPLRGKKFGFSYHHARSKLISFSTDYHVHADPAKNVLQKNLALASGVISILDPSQKTNPTIAELSEKIPFTVPLLIKKNVDNWMEKHQFLHPIFISPNTTWASKHWPKKHWEKLITLLSQQQLHPIILLGAHMGGQAAELATLQLPLFFVAPAWDLQATAHALSYAQLVIAPDTGILHLADAVGAPTLGIFGPTLPAIHGPILTGDNIKNNVSVPCSHFYKKNHGAFDCMENLQPKTIALHIVKHRTTMTLQHLNNPATLSEKEIR